MPPVPIRYAGEDVDHAEGSAPQPVAITQMLEDHVQRLEDDFRELDAELRKRFGDQSFSVERSEQLLAAIQRLRWAIAKSPVINPLPQLTQESSEQ